MLWIRMCIVIFNVYRLHRKCYHLLLSGQKELCRLVSVSSKASRGWWFVIIIPRPTAEAKVKLRIFSLTFQSGSSSSFSEELECFVHALAKHFFFTQHLCTSLFLVISFSKCSLDSNYLRTIAISLRTDECVNLTVSFFFFSYSLRFL